MVDLWCGLYSSLEMIFSWERERERAKHCTSYSSIHTEPTYLSLFFVSGRAFSSFHHHILQATSKLKSVFIGTVAQISFTNGSAASISRIVPLRLIDLQFVLACQFVNGLFLVSMCSYYILYQNIQYHSK